MVFAYNIERINYYVLILQGLAIRSEHQFVSHIVFGIAVIM